MKKWFKAGFALLMVAVLIIPLAACGQDKVQTVKVAEVTRSIFYAPQYVALEKGFFEEEGLKVELTTTWGGDKTMTAVLSNAADIGLVGSETSIYVYAQGSNDPVINFAQLTQTDGTFLVSREKIDDFSWDQLKGATYLGSAQAGCRKWSVNSSSRSTASIQRQI
ncbi:ABC transporter substrate-binding protein [Mesobacillus boroniphilus JCM 21738]|uniref:Thiamine pyrimidine synthase n=1 Tax=Mesobacillus boroniphilus JCM 21738 TaxID=1294265 RepID=W4RQE4_9BACI|nr:ABC transporter substrate-binding protein [Mesobacillus boroniphilus JCM 21738]